MSQKDVQDISKVIEDYVKAANTRDVELLDKVFYPEAMMINSDKNGQVEFSPVAGWREHMLKSKEKPRGKEVPVGLSINFVGNAATARMDWNFPTGDKTYHGTNYFTLVKRGGQWKISHKIWFTTGES